MNLKLNYCVRQLVLTSWISFCCMVTISPRILADTLSKSPEFSLAVNLLGSHPSLQNPKTSIKPIKPSKSGSITLYFFKFNNLASNIDIKILPVKSAPVNPESIEDLSKDSGTVTSLKREENEDILVHQVLDEGVFTTQLQEGSYVLKYKFKDKLTRNVKFSVYAQNETQVIVSFDDYEFNVQVEHPKTLIANSQSEDSIDPSVMNLSSSSNASKYSALNRASIDAESTGSNFPQNAVASNTEIKALNSTDAKIQGRVVDKESFRPINNANVLVPSLNLTAITNDQGEFVLSFNSSNLTKNVIEMAVVHASYVTWSESVPWPLKYPKLELALQPSGIALDQITVIAPHVKGSVSSMLNQRKSSMSVKDLLGSEQMAKSGDSSAASALRRVTGLSLVDGKYIYVRGLGERYSSTLLNGSMLPSPDPSRRVVPLDMFPSALIESIEVQKTYSADQLSEFGGGVVNITTKSIPDQAFARMSVNVGVSSEDVLTGKERGLFHANSNSDWTGYDQNNIRGLPEAVKSVLKQNRDINNLVDDNPFAVNDGSGFTGEEIEALGQSFSRNYNVKEASLPANFGMNFEMGDRFKRGNIFKIGGTAKLAYANATDTDLILQRRVDMVTQSEGVVGLEDNNTQTENTINFGGIFGLGLEIFKNHQINATQVITRSSLNSTVAIERDGRNNIDDTANIYRLRWQERELNTMQISGVHKFTSSDKGPKLTWGFTNSQAQLDEPDFREYYYLKINEQLLFADDKVYGNERSFSALNEVLNDFKISYESQARLKTSATAFMDVGLKLGFQNINKDREFNVRRFKFRNDSTAGSQVAYNRQDALDDILSDENIRPGGFRLIDSTLPTDNYLADQDVNAFYIQASNTFNFKYNTATGYDYFKPQLVYGLRLERSTQNVNTFDLNSSTSSVNTALATDDFLPSLGLNFALSQKHSLRFGFTKTVSRPDFKELSPARFLNDNDNIYEIGNPDLVAAGITNFDFRWDWYPTSKELLSVGVFLKNFENPIEAYAVNSTDTIRSYRNISEASNSGIEFEIRKDITEFLGAGFNTEVFSNYSLIASQVRLSAEEKGNSTTFSRPLQGQSPYLLNFGVDVTLPWYNLNTTLVYNIVGPRITDVGDGGRPDTYEQPIHQLDLSIIQKIKKNLNLTFRAQNLLDPDVTRTQGDFVVSSFQRGRALSLGLAAVF